MAAGTRQWGKVCAAVRAEHRPCHLHQYGMCKFNGEPIDYSAHHLQPRSFSGDHIIPTQAGGQDTYDNCGATHRRCNCARHDDPLNTLELTTTRDW